VTGLAKWFLIATVLFVIPPVMPGLAYARSGETDTSGLCYGIGQKMLKSARRVRAAKKKSAAAERRMNQNPMDESRIRAFQKAEMARGEAMQVLGNLAQEYAAECGGEALLIFINNNGLQEFFN
jgi:hypothetical protein